MPEENRAATQDYIKGLFDGSVTPEPVQQVMQAEDGSLHWQEWFDVPLKNSRGDVYEVQSIGHDITRRKILEAEQARLDKIVHESYNEIFMFNNESLRFEFANRSALSNLGYTLQELTRMKFSDLFNYPDEMALQALLRPLRMGETDRLQLQIKHSRKDGSYYDVDTVIQMLEKNKMFVAITTDITQKLGTERKLLATIQEKEILIKEIHHRVKNNLQLISSIIYIKMSSITQQEVKEFLEQTRQKIRSIALIHERLLQSENLDRVEISDYLGRLIYDLQVSHSRQDLALSIEANVEENILGLDTAIYCGLIVNELITNAIKHAFKDRVQGRIEVGFRREHKGYLLSVADDGISMPDSVQPGQSNTFGIQLLDIFIKQLGGTIEIIREKGTKFHMRFHS
jgi:PAS domain S-box-containing protein